MCKFHSGILYTALILASFPGSLHAEIPPDYYASAEGKTGNELREALHEIIDDHKSYRYGNAAGTNTWHIIFKADQDPNNSTNILDVYKNASYVKVIGGDDIYEQEHTWPSSYGFNKDTKTNYPYSDCHALMACDRSYNRSRGNLPYDTCDTGSVPRETVYNNGRGGESGPYPSDSNWRRGSPAEHSGWEVWDGRRGDVARALFYMDVRYEGGTNKISDAPEPDLILTDDWDLIEAHSDTNLAAGYMGMLSVLLKWHFEDAVDPDESNRNEVVFLYQTNRNPFVDNPEWVGSVFIPTLDIEPMTNAVRVRWESGMAELDLKSTEVLSNSWQAVTNEPLLDSQGWYLDYPTDSTNCFFRLSQ